MSEEILKALTQLFALICKQDEGIIPKERNYVEDFFKSELDFSLIKSYMSLFDEHLVGKSKRKKRSERRAKQAERPIRERKVEAPAEKNEHTREVRTNESVKILGICKKVNKTLTREQKIVVLFRILELLAQSHESYEVKSSKMEIIDVVADVFKFELDEYQSIRNFVFSKDISTLQSGRLLIACNTDVETTHINIRDDIDSYHFNINGAVIFIFVDSVKMYFCKYINGQDEIDLNNLLMKRNYTYPFSTGSILKSPKGNTLYSSNLARFFYVDFEKVKLSFHANNISFKFPNGNLGLRNINIEEGVGKLIGIMGASGAGKTTLLNCLAGLIPPSEGTIKINGIDIFKQKKDVEGMIGYVSQDDLLIDDLTVYENLYYNAQLCFGSLSKKEIHKKVEKTLEDLGLFERKHLKVGSPLEKTISGGQRKRLNIALELIREPAVLFVDEPTSGLSSRDSENVIDLLKELTLKGKLIYVVIHQPSSDIYKMFDKMVILDTGGYQIFYGNPVSAVTWFKRAANQVDSEKGNCTTCGNVNPEQIFNIIEAQVVDEFGNLTGKRKQEPKDWAEIYTENSKKESEAVEKEKPVSSLKIPNYFNQCRVFIIRDVLAKLRNKQYLLINSLESPLLSFILAILIRYNNFNDNTEYVYRYNDNIPAFFMMSIIVALFIGLSVSGEEIIKDRKILKREKFLNLSWGSYLSSKILILFVTSAIQSLTFVAVGHLILEIKVQFELIFFTLFSISCFANALGLNVSLLMRKAVNVYILVPVLLIPQMILSGLLFNFSKLNDYISKKEVVPIVADLMASRWAYEAVAVGAYKNNPYKKPYYEYETLEKEADFFTTYVYKELKKDLDFLKSDEATKDHDKNAFIHAKTRVINTLNKQKNNVKFPSLEFLNPLESLTKQPLSKDTYNSIMSYLKECKTFYYTTYNAASSLKEELKLKLKENKNYNYNEYRNTYSNESLKELTRNLTADSRVIITDTGYHQNTESVYHKPDKPDFLLNYRTHFFSPIKWFLGYKIPTTVFNLIVIWLMTLILILVLYTKILKKNRKV